MTKMVRLTVYFSMDLVFARVGSSLNLGLCDSSKEHRNASEPQTYPVRGLRDRETLPP